MIVKSTRDNLGFASVEFIKYNYIFFRTKSWDLKSRSDNCTPLAGVSFKPVKRLVEPILTYLPHLWRTAPMARTLQGHAVREH
jgi:hypothetical protein